MLDQMKMLSALGGLMKNRDKIAGAGERVKAKLTSKRLVGEAGGAKATVNGAMVVQKIELSAQLIQQLQAGGATRDGATQVICEAINNAITQAQGELKGAIDEEARALGFEGGIPDIGGLGNLLG